MWWRRLELKKKLSYKFKNDFNLPGASILKSNYRKISTGNLTDKVVSLKKNFIKKLI
jgi:hypothetical protein